MHIIDFISFISAVILLVVFILRFRNSEPLWPWHPYYKPAESQVKQRGGDELAWPYVPDYGKWIDFEPTPVFPVEHDYRRATDWTFTDDSTTWRPPEYVTTSETGDYGNLKFVTTSTTGQGWTKVVVPKIDLVEG